MLWYIYFRFSWHKIDLFLHAKRTQCYNQKSSLSSPCSATAVIPCQSCTCTHSKSPASLCKVYTWPRFLFFSLKMSFASLVSFKATGFPIDIMSKTSVSCKYWMLIRILYEVGSATDRPFNKPMTAPGNAVLNSALLYLLFLTNPVTDKVCRETIWIPIISACLSLQKTSKSLPYKRSLPFFFFFSIWRNVEERIMQQRLKRFRLERQRNHNNTSVSPSTSWGSWVELISHNISKQTLLAWLTRTTAPNWLPGVLRL